MNKDTRKKLDMDKRIKHFADEYPKNPYPNDTKVTTGSIGSILRWDNHFHRLINNCRPYLEDLNVTYEGKMGAKDADDYKWLYKGFGHTNGIDTHE
ncbi:hypothetical protein N7492_008100 [Penicillium capsulatum]|uniref:Uncharacterized protein n=1 Tax=Penicillium capsulatum TaxID=69766 RepID=A0A9W9HR60_9EURO|nr:hypothetical protein N7492_008100 [Penicillium capsulatum]KAJ6105510.1 hypothetical protein N7512_009027 [Penicillium capsulatum]